MSKPFELEREYRTKSGVKVFIVDEVRKDTDYWCVLGSDDIWRYNRAHDRGRVTASAFDMSEPLNLIPEQDEKP